jgi:tetratricopeptide (TPR) repeat protein
MRKALRARAGAALMGAVVSATLVTSASAALTGGEPRQQPGQERRSCTGRFDTPWDVQIKNCTALIQGRETIKTRVIAYNNRGIAYFEQQDYEHAIADYDEAIRLDPAFGAAIYNRGNAYRAKGDNDRAIVDYNEALRIRSDSRTYFNRGSAYRAKGENDRAIADYNEALRLDPNYAISYGNRGIAYAVQGDHDRAIADYNEAIRLNPKYANAYGNRGLAYAAKGDLDRAIADYDEALRIRPGAIDTNNRGLAYAAKGDLDRAIADYDEAIRLDSRFALAYKNRGEAYRVQGDDDRAVADFGTAITLDPKYSGAYFARGRMFLMSGSLAKAQGDLELARELAPKNANYVLWLDFAERRNHLPSRLAEGASQLDMITWPAPVIRLLLGETTAAALLAAAEDPDPNKKQGRVCEANFFSGEAALLDGAKQEAARLLRLAADDCPRTSFERTAANAELKALGGEP